MTEDIQPKKLDFTEIQEKINDAQELNSSIPPESTDTQVAYAPPITDELVQQIPPSLQQSSFQDQQFTFDNANSQNLYEQMKILAEQLNDADNANEFIETLQEQIENVNRAISESFIEDIIQKPQVLHYRRFLSQINQLNTPCKEFIKAWLENMNNTQRVYIDEVEKANQKLREQVCLAINYENSYQIKKILKESQKIEGKIYFKKQQQTLMGTLNSHEGQEDGKSQESTPDKDTLGTKTNLLSDSKANSLMGNSNLARKQLKRFDGFYDGFSTSCQIGSNEKRNSNSDKKQQRGGERFLEPYLDTGNDYYKRFNNNHTQPIENYPSQRNYHDDFYDQFGIKENKFLNRYRQQYQQPASNPYHSNGYQRRDYNQGYNSTFVERNHPRFNDEMRAPYQRMRVGYQNYSNSNYQQPYQRRTNNYQQQQGYYA